MLRLIGSRLSGSGGGGPAPPPSPTTTEGTQTSSQNSRPRRPRRRLAAASNIRGQVFDLRSIISFSFFLFFPTSGHFGATAELCSFSPPGRTLPVLLRLMSNPDSAHQSAAALALTQRSACLRFPSAWLFLFSSER